MELLARQEERIAAGQPIAPRIDAVLIVNGGLFADAHSHPWHATPLIKSPLGGPLMWATQRSVRIFGQVIDSANMFSKEYGVTRDEIREQYSAITRRAGAAFLHRAAGFVEEHKANADRWDLRRLYLPLRDSTTFVVAGSEADPYEHKQTDAARERLGSQGLRVRMFPGGHMTTSEHPDLLADEIVEVFRAAT
jgi:pimeloyl-ACP methyl ester carboxylesterase